MSGFHKLTPEQRLERLASFCNLTPEEVESISGRCLIPPSTAENWIENWIGFFPVPLGIATNFNIDGKDRMIPMAVEETSIIAAASATAKWIRQSGSIKTYSRGRLIIGQIQIPFIKNAKKFSEIINQNRDFLVGLANEFVPGLVARGGGVRDLSVRFLDRPDLSKEKMAVLHVHCDPCDAMGANLINQVCEGLKPTIEDLTREKVGLCILSNLVDENLSVAEVRIRNVDQQIANGIVEASLFAKADAYRATTHNKGVLNGIDPILIATGNDWRAVEAGIHAYATRAGSYQPITDWRIEGDDLLGRIEAPIAVGTVGGVTRSHPVAKVVMKILGVTRAEELGRICAAVGLVQNLGALRALSTDGIVSGHMRLHAANLAIAAGADHSEIGQVKIELANLLKKERRIDLSSARKVLEDLRSNNSSGRGRLQ